MKGWTSWVARKDTARDTLICPDVGNPAEHIQEARHRQDLMGGCVLWRPGAFHIVHYGTSGQRGTAFIAHKQEAKKREEQSDILGAELCGMEWKLGKSCQNDRRNVWEDCWKAEEGGKTDSSSEGELLKKG